MLGRIMRGSRFGLGAWALCLALGGFVLVPRPASAAPKGKARPAAQGKAPKKNPKKPAPSAASPAVPDADEQAVDADAHAADRPDKGEPSGVKAAGTSAAKAAP